MPPNPTDFLKASKGLTNNPLGIIALFIGLVYGMACIVFIFSAQSLYSFEREYIILFVVLFPCLVLLVFSHLVAKHHQKLYAPQDYRDDESFLRAYNPNKLDQEDMSEKVQELMGENSFQIVTDKEESIKLELQKDGLGHSGPTEKLLARRVAVFEAIHWFDQIYNNILGAQISFLQTLKKKKNLDETEAFTALMSFKIGRPALKIWTLEMFLSYLINMKLIKIEAGSYTTTVYGDEFLQMLEASGNDQIKA